MILPPPPVAGNAAELLQPDRIAIFLFHGVVESHRHTVRNYTRKHVDAARFRQVVSDLKAAGTPLSMDDVVDLMTRGAALPANGFAITFDDGFANNWTVAAPILDELKVPATFYVTTDFIENNTMSWIDRIEILMEEVPEGSLDLPWRDQSTLFGPDDRQALLEDIRAYVKSEPGLDIEALVAGISRQLGFEPVRSSSDPLDEKMSWDQVKAMADHPLFTVGGHSHTHSILAFLSDEALGQELDTSLGLLSAKAGVPSRHYSYPEGLAHCYDERVIAALKACGTMCAPSAMPGTNGAGSDLFHLRRYMVV